MPNPRIKKAEIESLTKYILIATTLAILLIFIVPKLWTLLTGTAQAGECNINFILTHLGETEQLKGCKMKNLIITKQLLNEETEKAKKQYQQLEIQNKLTPEIKNAFKAPTDEYMQKWAYNKIIAQEMADCVDKTLGGGLLEATFKPEAVIGSGTATCVVCTRIILTPDAQESLGTANYYLNEWMNGIPYKDTTYKEYTLKAATLNELTKISGQSTLTTTTYPYLSTDLKNPLAIMLINVPGGMLGTKKDLRWIQLYNYEDITKDTTPFVYRNRIESVTGIFYEAGDPIKCGPIIGTG